ncbi:MAG: hypothetical protein A2Y25_11120 [Candidatus Melainabacteria bacterium GWF2_37_15]|nr:MAG: hypothetical protein A2Y25_11120 [Candidatus Melainabacteria bacterium GWF2_37_15]
MKITDIDYYAEFGQSWLNKLPVSIKLAAVGLVLSVVVFSANVYFLGTLYLILLTVILFSSVPKFSIIKLSLYPLVFLLLFLLSVQNISLKLVLIFLFKALNASTALILLIFTTCYINIFSILKKFLPSFLVNILFLTYRSIFILARTLENLLDMMKFRGKPPLKNLKSLGDIVGFFVIKSIQTGENMYEAMKLRGQDY